EKKKFGCTLFFAELARSVDSIEIRHRDVDHNHVWLGVSRLRNQLGAIVGNSNDVELLLQEIKYHIRHDNMLGSQTNSGFHGSSDLGRTQVAKYRGTFTVIYLRSFVCTFAVFFK